MNIILILEDDRKFITAYPEYRTVRKCAADQSACGLYVLITCFMTLCIINQFQIIKIAYYYSEGIILFTVDLILQVVLKLFISSHVPYAGKTVTPCNLIGGTERLKSLLLLFDVFITVFDTYDEMGIIRRIAYRHPRKLRLSAVDDHSVVLDQLAAVLQTGNKIILVNEQFNAFPVFRMNDPVSILFRYAEEILALFLDLKFTVDLMSGKLRII